jgi:hypothetical protein
MNTKPTFQQNNYGVKSSSDMYRNIKGVHFVHYTSNPSEFEKIKLEAKKDGLKFKLIKDELFVEKK